MNVLSSLSEQLQVECNVLASASQGITIIIRSPNFTKWFSIDSSMAIFLKYMYKANIEEENCNT